MIGPMLAVIGSTGIGFPLKNMIGSIMAVIGSTGMHWLAIREVYS